MLSSDFANLGAEAERMVYLGTEWLHMDIMVTPLLCLLLYKSQFTRSLLSDVKHFVPNLTIGASVIESLRKHTNTYLDCHLMVTNPIDYVEQVENWQELVRKIKSARMRPGVALKPGTSVEVVYLLVEGETPVEMVLVMTVEPRFGGQKFMPSMMDKGTEAKVPNTERNVDG
ncbi:hypothetical protein Bca4012_019704 [Brassica carinata]